MPTPAVNAGSMLSTVKVGGERLVLTARTTAFAAPIAEASPCPVKKFEFDATALPNGMQFVSREEREGCEGDK